MRFALALLLLLVSSVASAQVYKCTHGGQVAYQDTPCAQGEHSANVDMGVDPVNDLVGCYDVTLGPWRAGHADDFMLEIKLGPDGYQLRMLRGIYSRDYGWRRADRRDLDKVEAASNWHLRAGLVLTNDPYSHPVPLGLYKGKDADNRHTYLVYFGNGSGPALKMACP